MDTTLNSPVWVSSIPDPDARAERLLSIHTDLEPYMDRMGRDQFGDFLESATFACGFGSLDEACEALIGPQLFHLLSAMIRTVAASDGRKAHVDEKFGTQLLENSSQRPRPGHRRVRRGVGGDSGHRDRNRTASRI